MIFLLVKDIDEWNILSLKNNIKVKKKMSNNEDENFQLFNYAIVTRILYQKEARSNKILF